jgi:hypothetical protein
VEGIRVSDKIKTAEFVVTAESNGGIEQGLKLAYARLSEGQTSGEAAVVKHGVSVKWSVFDVPKPAFVPETLLGVDPPKPEMSLPDLSTLDIGDAEGFIDLTKTEEDLDRLLDSEVSSERFAGGRKAVLKHIENHRKDIRAAVAKSEAKAAKKKSAKEA